jgi:cell division protein FtsQ
MDPRLAARRSEVASQKLVTRRRVATVVVLLVIVVGVAVGTLFTPIFDVDRIVVRGNRVVPADVIRRASGVTVGDTTLLVRTGKVDRRVERLPYVASARVKRVFPGTVIITVRERADAAWTVRPDGTIAVLDASGRVLAAAEVPPVGLARVDGLESVPEPGKRVRPTQLPEVMAQLPPGLASQVTVITTDETGIILRLVGDLVVRLGDAQNIVAKGAVAEAVIARSRPGTRVVDVRVPTSPVSF